MATKLIKLKELEYNEQLVIALIHKDAQLNKIFVPELKLSLEVLLLCSKENRLSQTTKILLRSVFDDVILRQSDLIEQYQFLAHKDGITLSEVKNEVIEEIQEPILEPVSEEIVEKTEEIIAVKTPKVKKEKENEIPRRYGKEKILKDIESQGGKATSLQNAMLRVNDLKNIYVNLSNRGIKDMCGNSDVKLLSDADCRTITAAIKLMEMKLETILKRK